MIKVFRAWLTFFILNVLFWIAGEETITAILKGLVQKINPKIEVQPQPKPIIKMQQNPYLVSFFAAAGIPKQEAEIRADIFDFDDFQPVPGKLYFLKVGYWVDC